MNQRILVTGSSGLIGTAIAAALERRGATIERFDLCETGRQFGDVRDPARVRAAMDGCDGVIHLAAVSRVVTGEREPALCEATNVDGVRNVLQAAALSARRPWVVSASSREVYGQQERLPVAEDCLVRPMNVYGRSKVAGEELVSAARHDGVRACTVRFSNVFGTTADHVDRVVPAFARGAAMGEVLRVDGADHTFDFTHIQDVSRGLVTLTELLDGTAPAPPPIHFVSGHATTLGELATMAIRLAGTDATVRHAPPRNFDVERFVGDGSRAATLLGWRPEIPLEAGLSDLIHAFRDAQAASLQSETAR